MTTFFEPIPVNLNRGVHRSPLLSSSLGNGLSPVKPDCRFPLYGSLCMLPR